MYYRFHLEDICIWKIFTKIWIVVKTAVLHNSGCIVWNTAQELCKAVVLSGYFWVVGSQVCSICPASPTLFPFSSFFQNTLLLNQVCFAQHSISQVPETLRFAAKRGFIPKAAKRGDRRNSLRCSRKARGWGIYRIKNKEAEQSGAWGGGERWLEKGAVIFLLLRPN